MIAAFKRHPDGAAKTTIRQSAAKSGETFQPLLDLLMDAGAVEQIESESSAKPWFRLVKTDIDVETIVSLGDRPDNRTNSPDNLSCPIGPTGQDSFPFRGTVRPVRSSNGEF